MRLSLCAVGLLTLAACATPPAPAPDAARYLTADEDAHLRAQCQPYDSVGGCVAVPVPLFQKLMLGLKACRQEHSL